MLVVTGSTGHVGRLVADELAARGHEQRLLVRDPARAPAIAGAEVVAADYADPASLPPPSTRATACSWSRCTRAPSSVCPTTATSSTAAAAAGVAHVVYLSFVAAGPDAIFLHARSHGATERMLADAGLAAHIDPQLDVRRRHPRLVRRRGPEHACRAATAA